jgi:TatA/E family protein of Tat protein translocase
MLPFGIGIPEVLMIFVVVLLVAGPSKLPELARTLGKGLRAARRAGSEIRNALDFEEPLNRVQREWVDPIFHDDTTADTECQMSDPVQPVSESDLPMSEPDLPVSEPDLPVSESDGERDETRSVSRGSATSSQVFLDAARGALDESDHSQAVTGSSAADERGETDPVGDDGVS